MPMNMQQLQEVILSDDALDVLDLLTLQVNRENISVKIDPNFFFCNKTGHVVGKREISAILHSIKIHGTSHTTAALYNSHGLYVHPAWLRTDNVALDELQLHDALGYVTYCLGLMTDRYYKKAFASRLHYANANAERYWAIARANLILQALSEQDLNELAATCCELLTFAPDTLAYIHRVIGSLAFTPDALALMAVNHTLIAAMHRATDAALNSLGLANSAIKRAKFEDIPTTPADAARGPSNIRKQRRSRRKVQDAEVDFFYRALMESGVLTDSTHQERVKAYEANKAMLNLNLDDLANLDLDAMDDMEDDDDDNEVIVRRIPVSMITGQAITTKAYQAPKATSALDRFRNKPLEVGPVAPVETIKEPASQTPKTIAPVSDLSRFRRT